MSLNHYLNRIRRLDALIRHKSTGPPGELAGKLDISERWLYSFLEELKEELDCPITYDRYKRSYVYEEQGNVVMGFQKELSEEEGKQVTGGINSGKNFYCMYLFSDKWLIVSEAIS